MTRFGIVAAGSNQSADAAARVLEDGGNAVDAMCAGVLATSSGDAAISSPLGGGVAIFRRADGFIETADFFCAAPGRSTASPGDESAASPRRVRIDFGVGGAYQDFLVGPATAAVPGFLRGVGAMLERWGTKSFAEVVQPAIEYADEGVALTEYHVACFGVLEPILALSPLGRRRFFRDDGGLLRPGDRFRQPELASGLRRIARDGLTRGLDDLDRTLLETFGPQTGGRITEKDLEAYAPEFAPPLDVEYGGARVFTMPAPSAGGRWVAATLRLFEAAGLRTARAGSAARYDGIARCLAAVSRSRRANPDLLDDPSISVVLERALSEFDDDRSREPGGAGEVASPGRPDLPPEPSGPGNTTHVSVVDRDGNVAGATVSHGEGSGEWVEEYGLHMNNVLGEEDLFPGGIGRVVPGTRLSTMMAPCVLIGPDGSATVFGTGGSSRIRSVLAQVVVSLVDDGLDLRDAVDAARLHVENDKLSIESFALPSAQASILRTLGRFAAIERFDAPSLFFGGVHAARVAPDGECSAAGDARRSGSVRRVEGA